MYVLSHVVEDSNSDMEMVIPYATFDREEDARTMVRYLSQTSPLHDEFGRACYWQVAEVQHNPGLGKLDFWVNGVQA
jgi:hypothetical protein